VISVLTPAFNEAENLLPLYDRLTQAMADVGEPWEWLVADDHSDDGTFAVVTQLATRDPRVRGIRLAHRSGSHTAITCTLHQARGDAAVLMAADLQDPPEFVRAMVDRWRAGAQVVWAVRRQRPGDKAHAGFAAVYYWIMRNVVGMKGMPARGADFFLIDRVVIDAFKQFPERNVSVLALITWIGFRQDTVEYDKQPRAAGRSGWTTAAKIKLVVDSVTAFSDFPIKLCWYAGLGLMGAALLCFLLALVSLPSLGGALLAVVSLVFGLSGIQLFALGIVGEYVWRAMQESKRRPQYLIERTTGGIAKE
jgi:glycosyltransferase involved in cell wall biosynthesis